MFEDISRRNLLRGFSISAAMASSGVGLLTLATAQHVHEAVAEEKHQGFALKAFNAHEFKTLERLSDLIVPADEHSPGALAAHAAEWIDYMAGSCPELAEI